MHSSQDGSDTVVDRHTNYSSENGGQYTFIHDGSDVAVPNDQRFWDDLIANKSRTGMFCYEQDWLNSEMDKSRTLGESATMGRTWMQQMNDGCAKANGDHPLSRLSPPIPKSVLY